jgi:hypothetical protein
MEEQENHPEGIPVNFFCNYACESCRQGDQCILFAFERLGKKIGQLGHEKDKDYAQLLNDIQISLDSTIELVKHNPKGVSGKYIVDFMSNAKGGTDLESYEVMHLSREFTNKAYGLLREISMEKTIPLGILTPLRDLQSHHTLVVTNLCRAMAELFHGSTDKKDMRLIAEDAERSLEFCINALIEIGKAIPEKRDAIARILGLSEKIKYEIHVQFL